MDRDILDSDGTITFSGEITGLYQVINSAGQVMQEGNLSTNSITIEGQSGLYFIRVTNQNGTIIQSRVVKE
ncbi:MAG: T9SS type A sorting domain-containing protein [Bacteroidota bacterium]